MEYLLDDSDDYECNGYEIFESTEVRWKQRAACANSDPDLFFPKRGGTTRPAKAVCAACEVRQECLEHALRYGLWGVWGGTNDKERRSIKKRRSHDRLTA